QGAVGSAAGGGPLLPRNPSQGFEVLPRWALGNQAGPTDDRDLVLQQRFGLDLRAAHGVRDEAELGSMRPNPFDCVLGGPELQRDAHSRMRLLEFGYDVRQQIRARQP